MRCKTVLKEVKNKNDLIHDDKVSASKMPVNMHNFSDIIKNDYVYVDKSMLIKEVIDRDGYHFYITRPSGFGKSINLTMLNCFFSNKITSEESDKLFQNLKISSDKECMRHKGQYNVIYMDFSSIKSINGYDEFVGKFYNVIDKVNKEYGGKYKFSKNLDEHDAQYLCEHWLSDLRSKIDENDKNPSIVLIDGYDWPLILSIGKIFKERVHEFLKMFLYGCIYNPYTFVAGITPINWNSTVDIKDFYDNFPRRNPLSKYFCLTLEEVAELRKKDVLKEELYSKKLIEGYGLGSGDHRVYNPTLLSHYYAHNNLSPSFLLKRILNNDFISENRLALELLVSEGVVNRVVWRYLYRDWRVVGWDRKSLSPIETLCAVLFHMGFLAIPKEYETKNLREFNGFNTIKGNIDGLFFSNIGIQNYCKKLILYPNSINKIEKAYTQGATDGALAKIFYKDITRHLGFFLTTKDGSMLAQTCRAAHLNAKKQQHEVEKKADNPSRKKSKCTIL